MNNQVAGPYMAAKIMTMRFRILLFTMIYIPTLLQVLEAGSDNPAQPETIGKILLQFFLVIVIGRFLTFLLQMFRDGASKRETVRQAKLEIIKQVDELYRSSKQIKRMIRSRMREMAGETLIKAGFFENQMDALSKLQLSLEQSRQTIRARTDFFDDQRRKRILDELRYTEAYLHDVIEEFEKGCIMFDNANYKITDNCIMLRDFLGPR